MPAPRTSPSFRGHRLAANGMPPVKPYVYGGTIKDPPEDPVKKARARQAGLAVAAVNAKARQERKERYGALRAGGASIEDAAAAVGITVKTARRSYEPGRGESP